MRMSKRARLTALSAATAVVAAAGVWALVATTGRDASATLAQNTAAPSSTQPPSSASTGSSAPTTTTTVSSAAPTTTTAPTTRNTPGTVVAPKPVTPAPMPAPTAHAVAVPVPPAPHPAPVPGCAPSYSGTNASHSEVNSALLAAGAQQYWSGASNPPLVAVDPPPPADGSSSTAPPPATPTLGPPAKVTVPAALIQAIAWQESGWQSAIVACDGGVGTMQVMAPTASWMNQRFGTPYDFKTLAGNAAIGAEYLEWLIAYFGENYFGYHYDITNSDLLTAVIAAYNAGPSAVTFAGGHTVETAYSANVKSLMSKQPWG
ncbi:transglycosylase SLT domain-containing protein [Solihabitans fulvus]|uniref:Transglycosylase SLT domain-containing protein n=1 Tax=Solihabitans fulvus TaxID=1892852 RepID=A0A5B2WV58_9PSEU|nr:transglycosylase SLT domain-containing protein [Solihabitans fulvus]KAA2255455.1 transglycosylase SLT domain-containing protein [Solihabitans fulvus]